MLKSIEKLSKNIIPKFYWSTPNIFGTYFFMYKNFEARFLETNFFYPAVKIASKLFNRFTWMKRHYYALDKSFPIHKKVFFIVSDEKPSQEVDGRKKC